MNNEDRIERVIILPGAPERVWKALTEPAQLARWFSSQVEVDLRVGGDILFGWNSGEFARARIEVVDPPHCFAFRWRPYKSEPSLPLETGGPTTLVKFSLEQITQGTRLTLVESGFAAFPAEIYAKSLADNQQGWDEELPNLVAYLQGN